MKVAGIIAEYNPFHNGHKYHLDKAREMTGADYCIVVMSGNYTQRGEPALMDKYLRTRSALENGADLVLELPVCHACASAPGFADGAVSLLQSLGVVDCLVFGSESGSTSLLQEAAAVLASEPPLYHQTLKCLLRSGLSYPSAQSDALLLSAVCRQRQHKSGQAPSPGTLCPALFRQQSAWDRILQKPAFFPKQHSSCCHSAGRQQLFRLRPARRRAGGRPGPEKSEGSCNKRPENETCHRLCPGHPGHT